MRVLPLALYYIRFCAVDKSACHISEDGNPEEEKELSVVLEQLATHIPDMVLYRSHEAPVPQIKHCFGVMMFLDVAGTVQPTIIIVTDTVQLETILLFNPTSTS